MFGKIIFYLIFAIVSQIITYIIIRKIDLKERKKLKKWEDDTIDKLIAHRTKLKEQKRIEDVIIEEPTMELDGTANIVTEEVESINNNDN